MTIAKTFPALIAATALAACNGGSEPDPEPTPTEATPNPEEPVSILRPDVEQPEVEATSEAPRPPLEVVIGFPDGGSDIDDEAEAALKDALESDEFELDAPIILRGHSDAGGNGSINERVSRQRAEAVRDWLVENGVDEDRIRVIAFGEQNPVAPNALPDGTPNEAGRAANRRVELQIVNPAKEDGPIAVPSSVAPD